MLTAALLSELQSELLCQWLSELSPAVPNLIWPVRLSFF